MKKTEYFAEAVHQHFQMQNAIDKAAQRRDAFIETHKDNIEVFSEDIKIAIGDHVSVAVIQLAYYPKIK